MNVPPSRGPLDHSVREQIVEAAFEHFGHYGYEKTTVAELAKSIGFSKSYIYKFFDQVAIDNTAKSDLNWSVYRYTDVLLMYAEAQVNADGTPNQQSIDIVNQIRGRAGLVPFKQTNASAFLEEVWDQRYFDLCYENKMWFDMLRTRKIRDDKSGEYVDFIGYKTNWGKVYTETQLLFPIPLSERQANPNLTQNQGY